MCYAVTALRILSFAPWTDKHFLGHIREIALCAIAKGWTHRNPNTMVSKNRVTTADICVAISSYDNENVFPPGEVSELDQTILEVCSDLFPQHVREFYSQFQFDCFSCQESITKNICLFDADAFQWTIPSDICLQEICTKMTPRYHFDKDGLKHKSDCCNNDAITFSQVEHGHLMIVIFRQELANLPSVSNCCHLLHQQIELDYLRSDTCGNGQQQMPIVPRQYQCSALIVCQTSDSASCNHFYLVEDQKTKNVKCLIISKDFAGRKNITSLLPEYMALSYVLIPKSPLGSSLILLCINFLTCPVVREPPTNPKRKREEFALDRTSTEFLDLNNSKKKALMNTLLNHITIPMYAR